MSVPGKTHDNRTPMFLECSWCGKHTRAMFLEDITITATDDNVTITKHFKLCLDCMIATLTMRGLHLARTKPDFIEEKKDEQEN